jgi:hypothetical protein
MLRVLFFLILVFRPGHRLFLAGRATGRTDAGLRRLSVSRLAAGGGDHGGRDGGRRDDRLVGDQGHLEQPARRGALFPGPAPRPGISGAVDRHDRGRRGRFGTRPRKKKDALKLLSSDQEPLILLLDAQASLLEGDHDAARAKFEAMLKDPELKLLGLRGLYLEARRLGENEAARHYAGRPSRGAAALLGRRCHAGSG